MTSLPNPKSTFLLGASLDILHQESLDWSTTIAFWRDEMKFFDKLLHLRKPADENKAAHKEMLENLEKIHGDLLDELEEDVIEHEKLLAKLERNEPGVADWDYREKHRRIKARIDTMMNDFNAFKKVLFGYVKNL